MIGSLHGVLASKEPPRLVIETGGVGYEVEAPMSTWLSLPPVGSTVQLRIHHVLREDASLLFGFATEAERGLFRALLKVSGVGPKVALAVLSGTSLQDFQQAVVADDAAALTRIPGIGRKTAERLLVEMRDYFKGAQAAAATGGGGNGPRAEAHHALLALGYKPAEATSLLEAVSVQSSSTEELIRAALQRAALR